MSKLIHLVKPKLLKCLFNRIFYLSVEITKKGQTYTKFIHYLLNIATELSDFFQIFFDIYFFNISVL